MEIFFRTPYNELSRCFSPFVYQERSVRVADTAVKQEGVSFSDVNSQSANSYYTNSDVPIKVFGPGVLASAHNPFSHGMVDSSEADSSSAMAPFSDSSASEVASSSAAVVDNSNS